MMNIVVIEGTLMRNPTAHTLASGQNLLAFDLRIGDLGQGTESVPVSWFDPPVRASKLQEGQEVLITGRIKRRFFRTGGSTASRTDVVANDVVPSTRRKARQQAIEAAADQLLLRESTS